MLLLPTHGRPDPALILAVPWPNGPEKPLSAYGTRDGDSAREALPRFSPEALDSTAHYCSELCIMWRRDSGVRYERRRAWGLSVPAFASSGWHRSRHRWDEEIAPIRLLLFYTPAVRFFTSSGATGGGIAFYTRRIPGFLQGGFRGQPGQPDLDRASLIGWRGVRAGGDERTSSPTNVVIIQVCNAYRESSIRWRRTSSRTIRIPWRPGPGPPSTTDRRRESQQA